MIKRIGKICKDYWHRRNSDAFIDYLRDKGITIGDRCVFRSPGSTQIDISRATLISIGDNVDMNRNFTIMAHDWASLVFRAKYHDFINSSGRVNIGDNVYFGTNVIVLGGVTIGDNCVIGAGSVVTKSIPSDSVAAGVPCRVICSLEDYYKKRKARGLNEAAARVKSIQEHYGRDPYPSEMREEFIYFVNKSNADKYEAMGVPIKYQLAEAYDDWMNEHDQSLFSDFEHFIEYVKNYTE